MANTLPAATIADIIMTSKMLVLQNRHLPFEKFSKNVSQEAIALTKNGNGPRATLQVELQTGGSTTLTNPTNYEQGDNTVVSRSVAMNEYSNPFHITTAERNVGRTLEDRILLNVHSLMNKLDAVTSALFTVANFGAAVLNVDPTTASTDDIKTLIAATGKFPERNLITDTTFWAQFAVTTDKNSLGVVDGAYGLDSMSHVTDWSNAGTNVNGIVAAPAAVAIAARLPENDDEVKEVIDMEAITLPNGLPCQVAKWVSTASRNTWNSLDIVYGAGRGDETAGAIITDGT